MIIRSIKLLLLVTFLMTGTAFAQLPSIAPQEGGAQEESSRAYLEGKKLAYRVYYDANLWKTEPSDPNDTATEYFLTYNGEIAFAGIETSDDPVPASQVIEQLNNGLIAAGYSNVELLDYRLIEMDDKFWVYSEYRGKYKDVPQPLHFMVYTYSTESGTVTILFSSLSEQIETYRTLFENFIQEVEMLH